MRGPEILAQIPSGSTREADGQLEHPLKISVIALTTPFSHEHYPLPLFSLTGAVVRGQPGLHDITLARTPDPTEILEGISVNKPDILALSAPQGTLETLDQTLHTLAQFPPDARPQTILGGSLPTYLPDRFFKKYPDLPMTVIASWGEDVFADIVKSQSLQRSQPSQECIIGSYPEEYPRQEGIPSRGTVPIHYPRVEASRGCYWGACSYCLRPLNEKRGTWRQYDVQDIISQISHLMRLGYTGYFEFADEEPVGTDFSRFLEIFEAMTVLKEDYPTFTFGMNMRADHVISPKPEMQTQFDAFLQKGKEAGLTMVWMGAESYSHSHLQKLRKGLAVSPETNLRAAQKLRDVGIDVLQGFIPYHPLSTWHELTEMAKFIEPHVPFLSSVLSSPFGFLRVQHNTPYLKMIRKIDGASHRSLLGPLDEDMLTYQCKYQDPSVGLHAAHMRIVYDVINPLAKRMNVEAIKGDRESKDKLERLRHAGLVLFIRSVKQTEPLKDDVAGLQEAQQALIVDYARELRRMGIDLIDVEERIITDLPSYVSVFL